MIQSRTDQIFLLKLRVNTIDPTQLFGLSFTVRMEKNIAIMTITRTIKAQVNQDT